MILILILNMTPYMDMSMVLVFFGSFFNSNQDMKIPTVFSVGKFFIYAKSVFNYWTIEKSRYHF